MINLIALGLSSCSIYVSGFSIHYANTRDYLYVLKKKRIKLWIPFISIEFTFIALLIGEIFFHIFLGCEAFSFSEYCLLAIPVKSYFNIDYEKKEILKENKNKSGIYLWSNRINNKCYIGSAIDLSDRLKFYFSTKAMEYSLKKSKSYIYTALLKYDYCNFSLTILEYCSPNMCIEREDYYLSILPHEYNILSKAGSPLGRKHSEETKKIMSDVAKKIKHSGHYKPGENHPNYGKKPEGSGKPSIAIEVTDVTNNTTSFYDSIHKASIALNISKQAISIYIIRNQKNPYKGRYIFKKL